VSVKGRFDVKHFVEHEVFRSGAKPFVASDYVGYSHKIVIYNVGEMVGGEAIAFHKDLVIYYMVLNGDLTVNKVFKGCFSFRNFHSKDMCFSAFNTSFCFFFRDMKTFSIVFLSISLKV